MTDAPGFWSKVKKRKNGCWEWQAGLHKFGYGMSWSRRAGRTVLAHRVSWEMKHGPIKDGLCVLHRCDNPPCVNPAHLFLGTKKQNTVDMLTKARCGTNKLTAQQAAIVQKAYKLSRHGRGRAENGFILLWSQKLGVSGAAISDAVGGRTWKHI